MGLTNAGDPAQRSPTIAVRFAPLWGHILALSAYVGAMLDVKGRREDAERVAIVVNELLENAVKYGDPSSEVKFELYADAGQPIVARVTNRAHPSRVAFLERELRRNQIGGSQEAFARETERLQPLPKSTTMRGLGRVALEAELALETTGNIVVATAKLAARRGRSGAASATDHSKEIPRPDERQQPRESRSGVSQTRRAIGSQSSTGQSTSSMKAAGTPEGGRRGR